MSRKLIFGYASIFLLFVVGVLAITNPLLMAHPLAFSSVFLPLLFMSLLLHYGMRNRSRFARGILNAFLIMGPLYAIGSMGAVGWGMFGSLLMGLALFCIRSTPAPTQSNYIRPVPPAHDVEKAARQEFPWDERRPAKSYSH